MEHTTKTQDQAGRILFANTRGVNTWRGSLLHDTCLVSYHTHTQKRHPGIGVEDTWNSRKYDDGIADDFVVKLEHLQPFEIATRSQINVPQRCLLHHTQGLGLSLATVK